MRAWGALGLGLVLALIVQFVRNPCFWTWGFPIPYRQLDGWSGSTAGSDWRIFLLDVALLTPLASGLAIAFLECFLRGLELRLGFLRLAERDDPPGGVAMNRVSTCTGKQGGVPMLPTSSRSRRALPWVVASAITFVLGCAYQLQMAAIFHAEERLRLLQPAGAIASGAVVELSPLLSMLAVLGWMTAGTLISGGLLRAGDRGVGLRCLELSDPW